MVCKQWCKKQQTVCCVVKPTITQTGMVDGETGGKTKLQVIMPRKVWWWEASNKAAKSASLAGRNDITIDLTGRFILQVLSKEGYCHIFHFHL